MGVSARAGTRTSRKPLRAAARTYMGVQINSCHTNYHLKGVCRHPGSKPDLKQRQERRRAKNKSAAKSRRINRK